MKKLFSIFLMAFVALAVQAQKQVVWEQPSAFMGRYNSEFKITKVELKPTETVLHITANYTPHYWIRFDKNSFLRTPDGTKYGITSGNRHPHLCHLRYQWPAVLQDHRLLGYRHL